MNKLQNKIVPVLVIISLFLGGFGIGLKQDFFFKPKEAQAQSSKLIKVQNDRFYKLVLQYLQKHKVLKRDQQGRQIPGKYAFLSSNKVNKIMNQLVLDGYFSKFKTKEARIVYMDLLGSEEENQGPSIREHLRDGFEKEYNYTYYLGNLNNPRTHDRLDWELYGWLRDQALLPVMAKNVFVGSPLDTGALAKFETIRKLAFDWSGVNDLVQACAYARTQGCIAAKVTQAMLVPKLRAKKNLTADARKRIYETPLFLPFKQLGWDNIKEYPDWQEGELFVFSQALELNDEIVKQVRKGVYCPMFVNSGKTPPPDVSCEGWKPQPKTYNDVVAYVKSMKASENAFAAAIGGPEGAAVKGGFGIGKATKEILYEYQLRDGTGLLMSTRDLRFTTSGGIFALTSNPSVVVEAESAILRGNPLKDQVIKVYSDLNLLEKFAGRDLYEGYSFRILEKLRKAGLTGAEGQLVRLKGWNDPLAKIMLLDEISLQAQFGDYLVFHEGYHTLLPNMEGFLAEAYISYRAEGFSLKNGFTAPHSSPSQVGYTPWLFQDQLESKLIAKYGKAGAKAKLDSFDLNPLHIVNDLDSIYGTGFSAKFSRLTDEYSSIVDDWFRAKLAKNPAAMEDLSRLGAYKIDEIEAEIRAWKIP